ncbi:hypothetical protein PR202_ga28056 [Eleusine coracana subsp. coracana]|uniref:Uncharacterized protein n=1 Tax=Eleusine coracana subsp. coracana TaxID=191504 RepID=A0AAV5DIA7_ELECO|nr:hypothetical protein PR202_ga28056 [Eleusine coracana subsp. coracana]
MKADECAGEASISHNRLTKAVEQHTEESRGARQWRVATQAGVAERLSGEVTDVEAGLWSSATTQGRRRSSRASRFRAGRPWQCEWEERTERE